MKKVTLILAALALVLGISQCKKQEPAHIGEKQHIMLTANNGNDGSKVDATVSGKLLELKWDGTETITVSGGATGTLHYVSGAESSKATFEGEITKVSDQDIEFSVGSGLSYMEQTGDLEGLGDLIYLKGISPYEEDGEYNVDMTLQYAVLKLDVSALGTEDELKIIVGGETIASVSDVASSEGKAVFVAVPANENPTQYTFKIGENTATKNWPALNPNIYYTANSEGAAIVIEPYSSPELLPGKFSVSATEYVQFSRGNLFCTRCGSEGSYTYEFGLENNQYDFRTRPECPSVINGIYDKKGTGANMSGHFQWDIAKAQAGKDYGAFGTTGLSGGTTSDILDWGPALDAASQWTTLSSGEWNYLVLTRKVKSETGLHHTCEFVYFKGVAGLDKGVAGLIIYPDDYDGEMFENKQDITAIPYGCVFIPMAGRFLSGEVSNLQERCNYWTSSAGSEGGNSTQFLAYGTVCHANNVLGRTNALSVRLVQKFVKP